MAVIPLQGMGERSAWSQLMDKYPTIGLILQAIGDGMSYFINGYFIVDLGRWLILTSGRISETALLFATLWVTAASVAPQFVSQLPGNLAPIFSNLSLMALTLLPEVVLFAAIITCYHHWYATFTAPAHRYKHGVWAVLYSIPTGAFFTMTAITIGTFVSIGHTSAAPHWMLTARCLSGWSYGLIGLVKAGIGRKSPVKTDTLSVPSIATIAQQTAQPIVPTVATTTPSESVLENALPDDTTNATTDERSAIDEEADSLLDSVEDSITFEQAEGPTTSETKAHAKPARGAGARKAASIIKRHPGISVPDLAKKANISQTYARQLRAKTPDARVERIK
jgi:hypothetical protein